MIAEGATTSEIARTVGYTERGILLRKARLRDKTDPRQQDLFLSIGPERDQG